MGSKRRSSVATRLEESRKIDREEQIAPDISPQTKQEELDSHGRSADISSLGCLFFELLARLMKEELRLRKIDPDNESETIKVLEQHCRIGHLGPANTGTSPSRRSQGIVPSRDEDELARGLTIAPWLATLSTLWRPMALWELNIFACLVWKNFQKWYPQSAWGTRVETYHLAHRMHRLPLKLQDRLHQSRRL